MESCQLAACCIEDACIVTNKLDCAAQGGNFLGGGDQPVVSCQDNACSLGSCCLDGVCQDDPDSDTLLECEAQEGAYFGESTINNTRVSAKRSVHHLRPLLIVQSFFKISLTILISFW